MTNFFLTNDLDANGVISLEVCLAWEEEERLGGEKGMTEEGIRIQEREIRRAG